MIIQHLHQGIRERYFPGLNEIAVLRLDLPDPIAGGNKSYKLKYHLEAFRKSDAKRMLSFGGAFSNHIAALAHAGRMNRVATIGVIRGDELTSESNAVLRYASACGMQLHFVSRAEYSRRYADDYKLELQQQFSDSYVVHEGGSGDEGIRGCMEILSEDTKRFDVIAVPVGTGATFEGLQRTKQAHQEIVGIDVVRRDAPLSIGGYARTNNQLTQFVASMKQLADLPLDHVYSGKTLFAVHQMLKAGQFPGKKLLFVHTGGYAFIQET